MFYRHSRNYCSRGLHSFQIGLQTCPVNFATLSPCKLLFAHTDNSQPSKSIRVAIYCRVSSAENKPNLDSQSSRLTAYCCGKGYSIVKIVKEVGSGFNDQRKKLMQLLQESDYDLIVCEHKDRLSRVGFNYIKVLLTQTSRDIEVVNLAEDKNSDLMEDFVSIITSFCANLYDLKMRKIKTEQIIQCLKEK